MDSIDKARDVREGEELDAQAVGEFLAEHVAAGGAPEVRQFPGGFSNLTYLLSVSGEEYILRRPPFGAKAKSAHDMGREFRILSALRPVFPYCPEPIAYTEDVSIIGCPFYIMRRIEGIILRRDLPKTLELSPERARRLCESLLDVQLGLHAVDYEAVGLGDFGKPQGYIGRQVAGWSERYRNARTDDAPAFEEVMAWIAAKQPPDAARATVIHNDYKFDNVVLDPADPNRIIGVLDWEMATIGDPLMDLGNSLAYWIEAADPPPAQMIRLMPTHLPGMMTRRELLDRYASKSGTDLGNFDFYYTFGLFRLAVIAQQIYYRYFHGQTKDDRFKMMIFAVKILEQTARGVIEKSSL